MLYPTNWVLEFLIFLSSSWRVPKVPARDYLSKVDNPGRSVPTAKSQVECTMRKAEYRW